MSCKQRAYSKLDENVAMMFHWKRTTTSNGEVSNFPPNMLYALLTEWMQSLYFQPVMLLQEKFPFSKIRRRNMPIEYEPHWPLTHVNGLLCASLCEWSQSFGRCGKTRLGIPPVFSNYGRVSTTECFHFSAVHTRLFHQLHFKYSQRIKVHVSWINWICFEFDWI